MLLIGGESLTCLVELCFGFDFANVTQTPVRVIFDFANRLARQRLDFFPSLNDLLGKFFQGLFPSRDVRLDLLQLAASCVETETCFGLLLLNFFDRHVAIDVDRLDRNFLIGERFEPLLFFRDRQQRLFVRRGPVDRFLSSGEDGLQTFQRLQQPILLHRIHVRVVIDRLDFRCNGLHTVQVAVRLWLRLGGTTTTRRSSGRIIGLERRVGRDLSDRLARRALRLNVQRGRNWRNRLSERTASNRHKNTAQ